MRLINSKEYKLEEALETECPMCGNPLNFFPAPFEEKIAGSAQCCSFLYVLKNTNRDKLLVEACVLPLKGE